MFVLLIRYHNTEVVEVDVEPCLSGVVEHLESCGVTHEEITANLKNDIHWYKGTIANIMVCREGSYDSTKLKVWLT